MVCKLKKNADGLNPEYLKIKFDHEANTKKLSNEFWKNFTENLFSSSFLVFLVTCLVIASGFVIIYKLNTLNEIIEYWKVVLPVVSTYIGYAIGKTGQK